MAGEQFWDHREAAQKVVEEAARLRKRTEPFRKAERQLEDLLGMVELGQAEDESTQATLAEEIATDAAPLVATVDELELQEIRPTPRLSETEGTATEE